MDRLTHWFNRDTKQLAFAEVFLKTSFCEYNPVFVLAETFPRFLLYNPERPSDGLPGLCDHQVCFYSHVDIKQIKPFSVFTRLLLLLAQPLPPGPLWCPALHE